MGYTETGPESNPNTIIRLYAYYDIHLLEIESKKNISAENEIENQKIITTYRKDQPPKNSDELIEILEQKIDEYDFKPIMQIPNSISVQYH